MQIIHPEQAENGIPASNIFYAINSNSQKIGYGFMSISYNPKFSSAFPINIYFKIEANGNARSRLFGALMAQAYQYCLYEQANLSARIYTDVDPEDMETLQFYQFSGLQNNDRDEIIQIRTPQPGKFNLANFEIRETTLVSDSDFISLANRLNDYRLTPISDEIIKRCAQAQNFLALSIVYGGFVAGEVVFYGNGTKATLLSMYVDIAYRQKGIGRALIRNAMANLKANGVLEFYSLLQRRSVSQRKLATACRYRALKATMLYPGVSIVRPTPMNY